ncbi:folate-like transporter 2 [Folsomia candida]|uniref:Thiamine transporter 2 n=1 Tax=Folsomia candida TaxID=158441 RepID=A0A226DWD8_FOLCA|nr:folate-like transporter 2 [Folsomia candida]XP_035711507.1 folate-like transporter 2 [Folsomia candida]OXA49037.1 Thiamine transporter 2 [Folsomia candida]
MKGKCKWKAAILVLIAVGLLKEFRPSGPFLVDYAVDHKNFTGEQMIHEVLPATTGSYIVSLVLLLMVTDALYYKPIIVAGGVYNILTWAITIWKFNSVNTARIRQIFYGLSVTTTEVAYFTYMYANIEKCAYKKVTSYTHSAVHFGQFVSGMTGQLLISFNLMNFEELNYLSLAGGVGALFFALFLPRVLRDVEEEKALKNADANDVEEPMKKDEKEAEKDGKEQSPSPIPAGLDYTRNIGKEKQPSRLQRWREAPAHWKNNILYTYTNRDIVKWSVWWAMSYGLYIQVDLYVEGLWKEIEHHSHQNVYNGAVHASHAIISVGLGLIVGRTKMCWIKWGCLVFGVSTVLQGVALFVMAKTHDLYVAYGMFILFQTMFQVLVIIAKSQVAESVREKTEAFIFGMNTLTACIIHLLLTMAVTSRHGFHLPIRDQYIVYGVYAVLLGVGFGCCDLPRKLAGKTRSWSVDVRNNLRKRSPKVRGENDKNDKDDEKELETISASMPYSIPREH